MKRRNLPPLNALKAFDAAARHGGFRAAADEMHVTHTVVGRHVRSLESRLGVELFEKDKRGVKLTEAGRLYAKKVSLALERISEATDELSRQHGRNSLRILAVPGFGAKWLSPRLHALSEEFPKLTIVVEPATDFADVLEGRADFGIGFGDPDEFSGTLEELARPEVFPVCSRQYLWDNGPFDTPESLLDATLLNEDFGEWWQDWFETFGMDLSGETRLVYSTATQAIGAAREHRGVALANRFLVGADEEDEGLVHLPLPGFDGGAYWFIWKDGAAKSLWAKEVSEWILREVSADPSVPPSAG
ncbi:MAG: LysR substrate-binding domain-containing protein [Pseudomonadota bacterium]